MIMSVTLEEKNLENVDNMTVIKYFAAIDKARQDKDRSQQQKQKVKNVR